MSGLSATVEWSRLLLHLAGGGQLVSPRGIPCREVIGYQSQVDMMEPILVCPARKLSYRFMCGEAWWILSGRNDVESISKYTKNIAKFSDNGTSFFGAYGPKLHEQLPYVIETLTRDPDSRQAVISIWRERPGTTKDVPCTVSWQFLLRDEKLHCNATMRSSDAWLGWPYDVFNFSMVTWLVCLSLKSCPTPGTLTLTAGSQHYYIGDEPKIDEVLRHPWGGGSPMLDLSGYLPNELVYGLYLAAQQDWETLENSPWSIFKGLSSKKD